MLGAYELADADVPSIEESFDRSSDCVIMESVRMRAPAFLSVVAASTLLVACSDGAPAPAADFSTQGPQPVIPVVDEDAGTNEPTADGGGEANEPCPPRSKRECMTTFRTLTGQLQNCNQSYQWCRGDGKGWHKCGFSVDQAPD